MLAHDDVEPIGLGARDVCGLKRGLCLYGHDIDVATTRSSGTWVGNPKGAPQRRRARRADFRAQRSYLAELQMGRCAKARWPVASLKGAHRCAKALRLFALLRVVHKYRHRDVWRIWPNVEGTGSAMGYVAIDHAIAALGTEIYGEVRGKRLPVTIAKPCPSWPANLNDKRQTKTGKKHMKFTEEHEWLRAEEDGEIVVSALPIHAASNWVMLSLWNCPKGTELSVKDDEVVVIESVKAASDILAPLDGEITEVNDGVVATIRAWSTKIHRAKRGSSRSRSVTTSGQMDEYMDRSRLPKIHRLVLADDAASFGTSGGCRILPISMPKREERL